MKTPAQINKKALLIVVLLIVLVLWIKSVFFPAPDADDAAGYIMPGTLERDFSGWEAWKYYIYFWQNRFSNYPFVVRFSYTLILFSITSGIVIFVSTAVFIYKRVSERRKYEKICDRFMAPFEDIMLSKEDLSNLAVINKLNIGDRRFSDLENSLILRLLLDFREKYHFQISLANRNKIIEFCGVQDYVTKILRGGKKNPCMKLLQTVRLLWIPISASLLARIINTKDLELRNMARLVFMLRDSENPYASFDKDYLNKSFRVKDVMEMHEAFYDCKKRGCKMPLFIPLIKNIEVPRVKGFFIQELGFWGGDGEVAECADFINDSEVVVRKCTYWTMGYRRYQPAVENMKDKFKEELESSRYVLLRALFRIHPVDLERFLIHAFHSATSKQTKMYLLYALMNYSSEGLQYYYEQKAEEADSSDLPIFAHVENGLIIREFKDTHYERIVV